MTTSPAVEALTTPARYTAAIARVRAAARAYYGGDGDIATESVMDDATYDRELLAIAAYEQAHPGEVAADSPTRQVAAGAAPAGDVAHTVPMLSLDNVFSAGQLAAWGESLQRRLGRPVGGGFTVEPKLDGAAIAARYRDGRLERVVTRGDGRSGEDVSHVIGTVEGLPERLDVPVTVEVRGEVLFTQAQFERANEIRAEHGAKVFSNPRNGAAGTLRAKDRPYRLAMTFWAYGAVALDGGSFLPADASHSQVLTALSEAGVRTTRDNPAAVRFVRTIEEVQARVEEIQAMRPGLPFGIDGVVVKADAAEDQRAAGYGSRFPHWAVAYKLAAVERTTRLLEVEWNVGRTGVLAPRARLEPVEIDGSVVEYATLHNPADIRRRDLHLGDTVTVYKAGDIIPRVQSAVVGLRPADAVEVPLPEACPHCGGGIDKSQERWRCVKGAACRLPALIAYAAQRDCLDIDGLGTTYVNALVASGAVTDIADLYTLGLETLSEAAGSAKRGASLLAQIEAARARPLSRQVCALGIRNTGRRLSQRIAAHFRSMDAIRAADAEAMREVEGIGAEKAPGIVAAFAELAPVIDKMIAAGATMTEPVDESAGEGPLVGEDGRPMKVVVTGRMTGPLADLSRTGVKDLIGRAGGKASDSVTAATAYLVAAPAAGGKLSGKAAKAEQLGVRVLTPEEFAELLADQLGGAV
ncbi:NAD-dependent DNA ligase LigA [Streptomyces sp. UH6]|uniref:NAD-dependent DNA ligase LigA n=1 Tax=Streptomyces sp. UH6 TaxID=2748379 RepID=UPI0015D49770|nr:NAD-dependent DNA ligase LigA [Streptomyces sp. UH6]NYV73713.1 NAD-dependent DNA ligase LigA [Streptomyces sp. UH6]